MSISYLNQIENNQRPMSAAVLLSLADKFKIDLSGLSGGENNRLMSALSETLTDPLFASYTANFQELKLVVHNAPGIAHALIADGLKRRFDVILTESLDRLSRDRLPFCIRTSPNSTTRRSSRFTISSATRRPERAPPKRSAHLSAASSSSRMARNWQSCCVATWRRS
jgi:hypothetical protein